MLILRIKAGYRWVFVYFFYENLTIHNLFYPLALKPNLSATNVYFTLQTFAPIEITEHTASCSVTCFDFTFVENALV